jgi:hypothetical protein
VFSIKLLKRCFHSSSFNSVEKLAHQLLDPPVRGLSKKAKEKESGLVFKSEIIDQRKEKNKVNHLAFRQLASDAPKKFLHEQLQAGWCLQNLT